ncbi:helix-turn-helix domain-containing protein (plasmid) [Nocardia sp. NBC_01377]|uniref:helix-turn-helix domain-containing protein n=1 Tax=Nocardia sp. NBC_01377 TaxID=2903595 RepID=UPI002F91274F
MSKAANLKRLGKMVRARRRELELNQDEVYARGGPSDTKLTEIEQGRTPFPSLTTLRKLDRALGWAEGYSNSVLCGTDRVVSDHEPVEADDELHDALAAAFARHGITHMAARSVGTDRSSLLLGMPEIQQLIRILNTLPDPGDTAAPEIESAAADVERPVPQPLFLAPAPPRRATG